MILKYIILALIAFGGGAVISGAVFALIRCSYKDG